MENYNYFKLFKIWAIVLSIYVVSLFVYLIISGRIIGEIYGGEILANVSIFILLFSGIEGVLSLIYSINKKNKDHILLSIGVMILCLILFFLMVILALSSIW